MPLLIVSISGIRGIIGDGLGPREALRFGLAYGSVLGGGTVVLGRASRPSGPMLADALRAGFQATGCRVFDLGILSTPGTSVMLRHLGADGGAIITASHNPSPYNGIKLLSRKGYGLTSAEGEAVLDRYRREAFTERGTDGVGRSQKKATGPRTHVDLVLTTVDVARIRDRRFTVVVDATNGAGGAEMSRLLKQLGCTCTRIHGRPTGRFGRGPEPVPENLTDLGRAVRDHGAALGLALDPDADRLALVDETGRPVGEEYTLALATRHRLQSARGPVACNLSTSRMMDDVAREAGVPLHRTPVGEVNVTQAIEREGCLIGGEGNGGVIDPRVAPVRNSLAGAALILEMMTVRGQPLSALCADLPAYTMVKDKVTLTSVRPETVFDAARRRFADATVDTRDGLYFSWPDGWLHVRASNTEPILRILAESASEERARGLVREVKTLAGA